MKKVLTELFDIETKRPIETGLFRFGSALIVYETIGGLYLLCIDELTKFDMMSLLGHIVLGFLFIVPCILFLIRSMQYRAIFQENRYSMVVVATSAAMFYTLVSGVVLSFVGVTDHRLFWWSHIAISAFAAIGFISYIALTIRLVLDRTSLRLNNVLKKKVWPVSYQVVVLLATMIALTGASAYLYTDPPRFKDRDAFGGAYSLNREKNFRRGVGSTLVTKSGGIPNEQYFLNSKSCGVAGCHADTYQQWEDSVHYRTPNPVFRGPETAKIEFDNATSDTEAPIALCAGCHAPVEFLSGLVTPTERLKGFEEFEGLSCIYCHSIQNVIQVSDGRNYSIVEPPFRYPFAFSDSPFGTFINNMLIEAKPEFHKQTYMKDLYKSSDYCAACHKKLLFSSWVKGPYNDRNNPGMKKTCNDCHMQQVESIDDVSAHGKGTVADHRYLASNIFIPGFYGLSEQIALTEKFLKDEKIGLSILAPHEVLHGSKVGFTVRMANVGVGHVYPSGAAANLVESWLEVTVNDDESRMMAQYGLLDEEGNLNDETTHIYRVSPYDVDGNPLGFNEHQPWAFKKHERFVLFPKTFDEYVFEVDLADFDTETISIDATARYRCLSKSTADFYFKGSKTVPITDMAKKSFEIAVRDAPISVEQPDHSPDASEIGDGLMKSAVDLTSKYTLTRVDSNTAS